MRAETQAVVDDITQSLTLLRRHLDLDAALERLEALNLRAEDPDLWNDPEAAQEVMRERTRLDQAIAKYRGFEQRLEDALTLIELGEAEDDAASVAEAEADLARLRAVVAKRQLASLLSGEADANDCYLEIHAGAGGTEAQDWAAMLARMYARWAEAHGYGIEWLEESAGEEAGIKSATLRIKGDNAYGWLRTESGVHRLVRISPFDADKQRHTSFALAEVLPDLGELEETEIDPKDIRIDTFLASGHGGQGVQTTYSAVRITHLPTKIVASCQNERSQLQNKETAMRILQARLHAVYMKEREEEKKKLRGEFTSAEWGNQIRSYVLHPYRLVKDHRTKYETQDTEKVLDGDLDRFIEEYLRFNKTK
ncbi:MAG: peptide chain release factor 2 [Proteobacteria bacterium]|nr:peptide chain release factor 2 [Pseudomonadota bacterium]